MLIRVSKALLLKANHKQNVFFNRDISLSSIGMISTKFYVAFDSNNILSRGYAYKLQEIEETNIKSTNYHKI